jgi:hypothetical protein
VQYVQFNLIHSHTMPFCGLRICFSTSLKTVVNLDKSFQYLPFWSFLVCWIFLNYTDLLWLKVGLQNSEAAKWPGPQSRWHPLNIELLRNALSLSVNIIEYLNIWISAYDCQSWNTNPEAQHRTCEKHDSIKMVLYVSTCIDNNNSKHDKY